MAAATVAAAVSEWPLSDLLRHHQQVRDAHRDKQQGHNINYSYMLLSIP